MTARCLSQNVTALAEVNPQLVERLNRPFETSHVQPLSDGTFSYRLHLEDVQISVSPDRCNELLPVDRRGLLFLFGAGLGELAAEWLRSGGEAVLVWDRDPYLLQLLLSQCNWQEDIRSQRLQLSLGIDILSLRDRPVDHIVVHPVLGGIYRNEFLLATQPLKPLAFVAHGGLFVEDVSDALRGEGYSVYTVDLNRLSTAEVEESVARGRPELLVCINHFEGLADFSERVNLQTIEWEIDPALTRICKAPKSSTKTSIFTWRRRHVVEYEQAGYEHVRYLPLASNPERRYAVTVSPDERAHYQVPVAFVGASMADRKASLLQNFANAWDRCFPGRVGEGQQIVESVLIEQGRELSRYLVPELLSRKAHGLTVSVGELEPEYIVAELAAAERRLAYVQALIPLGIHVWGDEGWKQVPGLHYRGSAEHGATINKIYSSAAINVDIGRLYQLDIVTMRVFDVLACRGFMLAEYSEDLEELFAIGEEVESWKTLDELLDKCRWYLNNPQQRELIAQRGYRAVCERHTIRQRLQTMMTTLKR